MVRSDELLERMSSWQLPRWRQLRTSCRLPLLLLLYAVFITLGAAIFSAIESPLEVRTLRRVLSAKKDFLQRHSSVAEHELEELIEEVIRANNRGVSAAKNVSTEPNWSFGQSFFFSATVVTTIGYGHVTPLSQGGKIFCVVFAVIGIPLTLMILSAFVDKLMVPSTMALQWLNARLGHLYQPFNIRLLHLACCGMLVLTVGLLVPALVFRRLESDWSYLDAVYYCFISLTTVGLGDYVPGDQPQQSNRALYKIVTTAYLLVGLVMMMWLLSVFAEVPQLNFGIIFMHHADEATAATIMSGGAAGGISSGFPADPEKMRLAAGSVCTGPKYTQQTESHVKVTSRPVDDSATSSEETTPVHARR